MKPQFLAASLVAILTGLTLPAFAQTAAAPATPAGGPPATLCSDLVAMSATDQGSLLYYLAGFADGQMAGGMRAPGDQGAGDASQGHVDAAGAGDASAATQAAVAGQTTTAANANTAPATPSPTNAGGGDASQGHADATGPAGTVGRPSTAASMTAGGMAGLNIDTGKVVTACQADGGATVLSAIGSARGMAKPAM